ncbi:TetR/AcrR family transcriptional regulator [Actinotalea sp. M2MS4P-6]|uniref:TetR/AcrR family transcriptional regulator n=1 Tax=Actinotalea sp. M2MS4P-6 TaxID=2983762 RepID=UPI0021E46F6D|nr:TetR/AcrR family transcriptional regulator [Actinotalea sp. M2MS4P-6]MCV2395746.1 TetR/AcrR family transcriptional regulator [Actinotalea sp. M2MS4P-6]
MDSTPVKGRRYDASGRRRAAEERRRTTVDQARALFLERGFAGTTVAAVAERAEVSVETIYKSFGGKAGLVRAVWQQALEGTGPVPAEERSDAVSSVADDPLEVIGTWARLSAEVGERAAPVLALVREAAAADPEAADLLTEIDDGRLARMVHNAEALARHGHLRPSLSTRRAAEAMTVLSSSLHDPLVDGFGWSAAEYSALMARLLAAALLDDRATGGSD